MRQFIESRWFAIADLLLVMMSAAAWMFFPKYGIAFSLIALLPWAARFLAGRLPFRRTPFDWLLAIFLVTAWIGYWSAYDKSAAWSKVWLIVSAILLYYAVSAQPKQNLSFLSFLSFCFALSLFIYTCVTYDFAGRGGRIAHWWMAHRPHVDWTPIHLGYVAGLILITTIWAFYWFWNASKKFSGTAAVLVRLFLLLGMGVVVLAFVLTLSRGIEVIAWGSVGLLVLWSAASFAESNVRVRFVFPILVLGYLAALMVFAYLEPSSDLPGSTDNNYGTNARAELVERGAYFLVDYPITGAGLDSFPGLYSQYILVIPQFYSINSYNLFLDVAIEQGIIGGLIFIFLYLGSVLLLSQAIANNPSGELRLLRWLCLAALMITIVHGLFYDYLYSGKGTVLLFYPLGMAMTGVLNRSKSKERVFPQPQIAFSRHKAIIGLLLTVLVLMVLSLNKILPLWYANLGAVQMSQAELKDFPTGKWETSEMAPRLELAATTLRSALRYQPHNQTANYRLGLISMLHQDFKKAAANLETAHQEAPNHRGIIKSLAYCYVWLGEIDKAQPLLERIPEAKHEMEVYIWWWETQDRPDLSENAAIAYSQLSSSPRKGN